MELETLAALHVRDIVRLVMKHTPAHGAVVVSDTQSELARVLTRAYAAAIPDATFVHFDQTPRDELLEAFATSKAEDLIVLVQSTSFRMEGFRIRVELLKRGLKVIEHSNLARITESERQLYVEALAYDPEYYGGVGRRLKARIDQAVRAEVHSGGVVLVYDSGFEPAKLNTGDFSTLKNVASTFPIGEVFTEPRHLERVNGRIRLHAFSNIDYVLESVEVPITIEIRDGRVVSALDSTPSFDRVLERIAAQEGEVLVRELGFGMNRAFSRTKRVSDVTAYERVSGIHLSLGAKHGVYKKAGIRGKDAKYHLDVFAVTEQVRLDDEIVYSDGGWTV